MREPFGDGAARIGLGCLRLVDESVITAVVGAALAAGVRLFDTARAYGNEAMLGRALAGVEGVEVVTKAGMARPDGAWLPDGRAKAILASAEASVAALGRVPDLLLLHAPDPRVSLATSVRALAAAARAGLCRAVGLCNVNRAQLEAALAVTEVAAIQVRLGFGDDGPLRDGLVAFCHARGIRVLAHTPLGGGKRKNALARDPRLAEIAARHDATPAEVQLALFVAAGVSPLAGATRVESAASLGRAARLVLPAEDRVEPRPSSPIVPDGGEVVLVIGSPAAGKSTLAAGLVAGGHERLNRDVSGGSLDALAAVLDERIAAGGRRFVLDNTYPSRRSRQPVIAVAARHGLATRCLWLDTSLDDALVNAAIRAQTGGPELPPRALYRHRDAWEPPALDEGLAAIERIEFVRQPWPGDRRGFLVDLDHSLWRSRAGARAPVGPDDIEVDVRAVEMCRARRDDGWIVAGVTWQPAASAELTAACLARLAEIVGFAFPVAICDHPAGPPRCLCRKPLPGLGVRLILELGLSPSVSEHLGGKPADRLFAQRLGMTSVE